MMFTKYNDFKFSLNENVQQGKDYMKKLYLNRKKAYAPEGEKVGLDGQEQRLAETDDAFKQVKDIVAKEPGWTWLFTKFFFDFAMKDLDTGKSNYMTKYDFEAKFRKEGRDIPDYRQSGEYKQQQEQIHNSVESLKVLYADLVELKQSFNLLPIDPASGKPLELLKYPNLSAEDEERIYRDGRVLGGYERLADDLRGLRDNRVFNAWISKLPANFRNQSKEAPVLQKGELMGIAKAFSEFGQEPNGSINDEVNKSLQRVFFSKIADDKSLEDMISRAQLHIKATSNANMSKLLQAIQKVNDKYGPNDGLPRGIKILRNQDNIIVFEVYSQQALREVGPTAHCIVRSLDYWNRYVGGDGDSQAAYNKQYYVFNFNLSPDNMEQIIGVTIQPGRSPIYACHRKDDGGFTSQFFPYLKKYKIPEELFAPMSEAEVQSKKKRIQANREIVKEKLSLDQIKKYLEDGADPNAGNGTPLVNAVKARGDGMYTDEDYEKVNYLINKGALPNIGKAIKEARSLKMIKLLVSHKSTLTGDVFQKLLPLVRDGKIVKRDPKTNDLKPVSPEEGAQATKDSLEAIEYCLDNGVDPNFESAIGLRKAIAFGDLDIVKLLIKYGANLVTRRYMAVRIACEWGKLDILKYVLQDREKGILNMRDPKVRADFDFTTKEGKENSMNYFKDMAVWATTSDKVPIPVREEIIKWIETELWSKVSDRKIEDFDSDIRKWPKE